MVGYLVYEKIFRAFVTTPIAVDRLPEERRPERWEENFELYLVRELRKDFVQALGTADEPSEYTPFLSYLTHRGRIATAEEAARVVSDAITGPLPRKEGVPAKLASLSDVEKQMRRLLDAAPTAKMRDEIIRRMKKLGVGPSLAVFNRLIDRS